ncbi:MAG: hypothetical protein K2L09_02825, partial [Alistipes sp.]|nr:hypothetical protein [Alistipes sp.]
TDGDENTPATTLQITANVGGASSYDADQNKATVTQKGKDVASNNLVGTGYKDVSINVTAEENDIINIITAGGLRIATIKYTYFDTTAN